MGVLLLLPLIFISDSEFTLYGVNIHILNSIVIISGLGFPVELTKQYGFNRITTSQFNGIIFPIHFFSILILLLVTRKLNIELKAVMFPILFFYVFSEVIILDTLRQFQAISNYRKHILLSAVKSILSFLGIIFLYLLGYKISFSFLLSLFLFVNIITIIFFKILTNISFKGTRNLYSKHMIISSALYFSVYFFDRYLISFDKVIIMDLMNEKNLKMLLIIYPLYASSFSFIEGTFFVRIYNRVLLQKAKSFNFMKGLLSISLLSTPVGILIYMYLFYFFPNSNPNLIEIIISTYLFTLSSGLSWFYSTKNYGDTNPQKFLLLSALSVIFYFSLIFMMKEISIDLNPLLFVLVFPFISMTVHSVYRLRQC